MLPITQAVAVASPWVTSDFVKLSLPQVTPAPSAAPRHYLLHNRSGWSEQSDIHCDDRVSQPRAPGYFSIPDIGIK